MLVPCLGKLLLTGLLWTTATAKLYGGVAKGSVLDLWGVHYYVIVMEYMIGVALWCKWSRLAAISAMVLFGSGILIATLGSNKGCGCWGAGVEVSRALHLVLCGCGGLLACVAARRKKQQRPGASGTHRGTMPGSAHPFNPPA